MEQIRDKLKHVWIRKGWSGTRSWGALRQCRSEERQNRSRRAWRETSSSSFATPSLGIITEHRGICWPRFQLWDSREQSCHITWYTLRQRESWRIYFIFFFKVKLLWTFKSASFFFLQTSAETSYRSKRVLKHQEAAAGSSGFDAVLKGTRSQQIQRWWRRKALSLTDTRGLSGRPIIWNRNMSSTTTSRYFCHHDTAILTIHTVTTQVLLS